MGPHLSSKMEPRPVDREEGWGIGLALVLTLSSPFAPGAGEHCFEAWSRGAGRDNVGGLET